jgi:hypothetical protein
MRHQIDLHKARHRLAPVGERLDRDLVLEQRARPRGADAAFGQPSARSRQRSIDGGRTHLRDPLDCLGGHVAERMPVA